MLKKITVPSAIKARIQFWDALLTADGKAKTNTDNNRTSYNRRQITHDALYANYLNDHCKYQIQKTCYKHTTACIWKLLSIRHVGKNSGVKLCNGGKSAKKCK